MSGIEREGWGILALRKKGILVYMSKSMVFLGMTIGSTIGSFVPILWGASVFSFSSIIFSFIGGVAGIWAAWRLMNA